MGHTVPISAEAAARGVKAGDLLLRLESTTEERRLQATRRAVETQRATLAARAAAVLERKTMDRAVPLHLQGDRFRRSQMGAGPWRRRSPKN